MGQGDRRNLTTPGQNGRDRPVRCVTGADPLLYDADNSYEGGTPIVHIDPPPFNYYCYMCACPIHNVLLMDTRTIGVCYAHTMRTRTRAPHARGCVPMRALTRTRRAMRWHRATHGPTCANRLVVDRGLHVAGYMCHA